MYMDTKVSTLINKINPRKLQTNTQKVLYKLLSVGENEWVSRSSIKVPSASARLRDLRKPQYGSFVVECVTAKALNKRSKTTSTTKQTFYRINSSSITLNKVASIFEGVIA